MGDELTLQEGHTQGHSQRKEGIQDKVGSSLPFRASRKQMPHQPERRRSAIGMTAKSDV
jgi:hypothetical protein